MKRNPVTLVPALIGELAHAYMHRDEYDYVRNQFPALCAEYIVCSRCRISLNYTRKRMAYLTGFMENDPRDLRAKLDDVRTAANGIHSDIERYLAAVREAQVRDASGRLVSAEDRDGRDRS